MVFLALVAPLTYFGSLGFVVVLFAVRSQLIELVTRGSRGATSDLVSLLSIEITLAAAFFLSGRFTRRMIAGATSTDLKHPTGSGVDVVQE